MEVRTLEKPSQQDTGWGLGKLSQQTSWANLVLQE